MLIIIQLDRKAIVNQCYDKVYCRLYNIVIVLYINIYERTDQNKSS